VVAITKIAGYTQEDNNYMLTINNNKTVDRTFSTSLQAYGFARELVNKPAELNAILKGL
jgi:hypothetical protein